MYTDFSTLPADAQGFIYQWMGVLCKCDKEELKQDRSCGSGVSLLCFLLFGSPVCRCCAVFAAVLWGGEHVAGVWGWTGSPLQSVPLVCHKEHPGMLSCLLCASGGFREQPCTHSSLSPCAAVQGLGTVVFQTIALSCVFCQSKCLLKAFNCIIVGALL